MILSLETGVAFPASHFRLLGSRIVSVIFPEATLFVQQRLILEICGVYEARGEIYTFMLIRWHEYGVGVTSTENHKLRYYPNNDRHKQTSIDNEIMAGSTLAQEILYGNLRSIFTEPLITGVSFLWFVVSRVALGR